MKYLILSLTLSFLTGCSSLGPSTEKAAQAQLDAARAFYLSNTQGYWADTGRTEVINMKGMQITPIPGVAPEDATLSLYVPRDYKDPIQYQPAGGTAFKVMDFLEGIAPWAFGYMALDSVKGSGSQTVVQESSASGAGFATAPILPAAP